MQNYKKNVLVKNRILYYLHFDAKVCQYVGKIWVHITY